MIKSVGDLLAEHPPMLGGLYGEAEVVGCLGPCPYVPMGYAEYAEHLETVLYVAGVLPAREEG